MSRKNKLSPLVLLVIPVAAIGALWLFVRNSRARLCFALGAIILACGCAYEERFAIPYLVPAAPFFIAAAWLAFRPRRRPEPMTPERLASILSPYVEATSDADRALLLEVCTDAMLSPNFKDYWNAAAYNPGKRATRAQLERIREMGYTGGKMPTNIREASALIELLQMARSYKRAKRSARECGCDTSAHTPS